MPVHCGGRDLPASLESIAAERPDGVEILIYDSSPDGTCTDIVRRYVDILDIQYVHMPELGGWPDKTNLAVANASAPFVAMLHQDDIWLPGHLTTVRHSIASRPEAVMHVAPSRLVDAGGTDIGKWSLPLAPSVWPGSDFGRCLIVQNFVAVPAPVIMREAWLATGNMDPTLWYTADWDLYLKLAKLGPIAVTDRATVAFRLHSGSLTMKGSRNAADLRQQFEIVLCRHGDAFGLDLDRRLRARARASAAINCALAAAAAGSTKALAMVMARLLALGPFDACRYLHESRLYERLLPRIRLRVAGSI